jgi:thiosulfate dehydrogenase [quinone] large subunit
MVMIRSKKSLDDLQLSILVILRIAIGWHFLYEGLTKILNPNWSSIGYLMDSKGFMSGLFHSMATNANVLLTIDFLNKWGLVLIGLGLILGSFTRIAAYCGMVLLAMYYLSHPPFIGVNYALPTEGNYLFVDKVFIEFFSMWILALIPTGTYLGLDRLIYKSRN